MKCRLRWQSRTGRGDYGALDQGALEQTPLAAEGRGGRSRPAAGPARRGSLDGPVSGRSENGGGSPSGLPGCAPWCHSWDAVRAVSSARRCWLGNPGPGCRSSLRRARRHGAVRPQPGGLNQARGRAASRGGDHDKWRARAGLRPFRVSPRLGQATDLPVAQAVVDEGEKLAGRRHPADVRAASLADAAMVGGDGSGPALADDAFDRCPAHQA
jgi:hypothetical protein